MTQMVELVQLRKFTPGRAAFAAKSVIALTRKGEEPIAAEAVSVQQSAQTALEKRRAFRTTQASATAARGGGKAAALDNQVDRLVSAIHTNTQSFLRALEDSAPEAAQAKEVLVELFPRGAADITGRSFEDESAAVQLLVKDLQGRFSAHTAALGLGPLVTQLAAVQARFADALGQATPSRVSFDVVAAAENEMQEALAGLVLVIAAHYRGSQPANVARRAELLAPIHDQDARIADAYRRRRPVTDVDPETGTETEVPAAE